MRFAYHSSLYILIILALKQKDIPLSYQVPKTKFRDWSIPLYRHIANFEDFKISKSAIKNIQP